MGKTLPNKIQCIHFDPFLGGMEHFFNIWIILCHSATFAKWHWVGTGYFGIIGVAFCFFYAVFGD
jgi:hypothetical protein